MVLRRLPSETPMTTEKSDPGIDPVVQAGATRADLVIALLLSAIIFAYAHWQALTKPFVINDDVRQQIFWMQQWQDPELFKGDVLSDYARHYVTWGIKAVYRVAALGLNPMEFSQVLPGILFVWLAGCLFKIGNILGQRPLAWMTLVVFWLMPFFLDNLAGGLARAFVAPLLASFLLCWFEGRAWGMGLTLLLQALFIPYIFTAGCGRGHIGLSGEAPRPRQAASLSGAAAAPHAPGRRRQPGDSYEPPIYRRGLRPPRGPGGHGQSSRIPQPRPVPFSANVLVSLRTHQPLGVYRPHQGRGMGRRSPGGAAGPGPDTLWRPPGELAGLKAQTGAGGIRGGSLLCCSIFWPGVFF
jgi:hypothetical protein